ncbi:MAG: DUF6263 family protein [Bacteroidota bacterium]|nr:DUF6263 family protein [Bacteroidota bacterium]MDP4205333.1 DUF6263 family protein [Bacteroidota bacterium]
MKKLILIVLGITLSVFAFSAQKSEIKLNLTAGKTYKLQQKSDQTITQSIMGNEMNIHNEMSSVMAVKVIQASNGIYQLEITTEKMSIKMTTPMSVMEFDSQKPVEDNPFSKSLSQFVGKSYKAKINKSGQILEIKGMTDIMNNVINSFTNLDANTKAQLNQQLSQMFGDDALKEALKSAFTIYPQIPVAIGDSWNTKSNLAGLPIIIDNTWTLAANTPTGTTITSKSTILPKGDNIKIMGFSAKYNVTGTMVSSLNLDPKSGWTKEGKSTINMSGKLMVEANDQLPQGIEIPLSLKSETTISAVE